MPRCCASCTTHGKGIVWFHGSAAQEDDWGYPEEYNVMRGAKLSVAEPGCGLGPWGETLLQHGRAAASDHRRHQRDVDRHRRRHPHRSQLYDGAQVLLTAFDDLESYEKAPVWPMSHYPVAIPPEGIAPLPGMNTDQPIAWINEYGAGRSFTITIGHDIDTFRRSSSSGCSRAASSGRRRARSTLQGPDRRGERRFLPWPYYNHEG